MPFSYFALVIATLVAVAACSNNASDAATATHAAARGITGNVCDLKLLTPADFAGMTRTPITLTEPLPGDPATCKFLTNADPSSKEEIHISLRPGLGRTTLATFTSGRMDEFVKWEPQSGVGDAAIWKPELKQVSAQQGDVLCEAGLSAMTAAFDKTDAQTRRSQLGNLCNIVFQRLKSLH